MLRDIRKKGQENSIICKFDKITVWLGRSAVICVEYKEQRQEDAALWGASGGEEDVEQGVVHPHSPVC